MNRKLLLICVLLVILTLAATACRLPAGGSPPPANTPVPSPTTGVIVVPTNTLVPTVVVLPTNTATPTPLPPTPAPPTPVPTTTPPQAIRIQFAVGGTSAAIDGNLNEGQTLYYVLQASATQTMNVKISSPNADVYLGVVGADGQVLLDSASQDTLWSGTLPKTQDYYISLRAGGGKTSYTLSVDIPPLLVTPTPIVTPVSGTFDPQATYGNPTFEDDMTGKNIDDWVNPSTGLLPDTNYFKIVLSNEKFYVTGKEPQFSTWYFTWRELGDFYLQSTFDSGSCSGMDAYGLIIRGPGHLAGKSFGYVIAFSCDGQYWIFRLDSISPWTTKELVSWSKSDYITAGANKQNVMGIKAIGSTLTIYANGHQIAQVTDSKYALGRYGLFVSPDLTANYTYRVVKMSYWDLTP